LRIVSSPSSTDDAFTADELRDLVTLTFDLHFDIKLLEVS